MPAMDSQGPLQWEDYSWLLIWTQDSDSVTITTVLWGESGARENEDTQGHIYLSTSHRLKLDLLQSFPGY